MGKKPQTLDALRQAAARALCRMDGHPENATFEGKPMWMSYLPEVDVVFAAIDLAGIVEGGKVPPLRNEESP